MSTAFTEPLPAGEGDLQRRLLSVSGNGRGDYWHVAWQMARDEPLHGAGAGSFEAQWLQERPISFHARDAHNLYLETLAELGSVGLAAPSCHARVAARSLFRGRAAFRSARLPPGRSRPILLHASVDWDWEVPAVTLSALFCAATLLFLTASGVADS